MKHIKQLAALLLALALALGVPAIPAAAYDDPGWAVDREHPVIIVHGIFQSEVYLYEEDNATPVLGADGRPVRGWPVEVDINALIPGLIFPLLGSLLLQSDLGLTKAIRGLPGEVFSLYGMDETARPVQNLRVAKTHRWNGGNSAPTSLAELDEAAKRGVYGNIPVQDMAGIVGEENVYYFAYDSLGNLGDIVDDLYITIQDILEKHGTDKVSVIPISLGGTIMNALVEYYKDANIAAQLKNVVYVIAALDGSALAGDLFTGRFAADNVNLYKNLLPSLVEGPAGYLLNIVLRLLPKRLVLSILDAVLEGLVGDVVGYITMLWALVPQKDYETAAAMWLGDPKMAGVKAQTDKYHNAQANARKNILALRAAGVNTYAIAEFNIPLYPFVASAFTENSDVLLHLDSPSMGATYGYINTPLPADYVPETPGYMSPCRIVDASTGALPDHTWYFKDQDHERTGRSDVIMRLTMRLACSAEENISVHTLADTWPQFNYGRDGRWLTSNLANYKDFGLTIEDEADRAEFIAAYAALEELAEASIVVPAQEEAVRQRFTDIMVKLGVWSAPQPPSFRDRALERAARFLSDAFYYAYGPRGFIDPIWRIWRA